MFLDQICSKVYLLALLDSQLWTHLHLEDFFEGLWLLIRTLACISTFETFELFFFSFGLQIGFGRSGDLLRCTQPDYPRNDILFRQVAEGVREREKNDTEDHIIHSQNELMLNDGVKAGQHAHVPRHLPNY